jgi:hypothetical protein
MKIKEIIKNNIVEFDFYREGNFFYKVETPEGFYNFKVPLEDIGNATLLHRDKAILFMRYIRKSMEDGTFVPRA